jgi:DNA-binding NtrC family response regulator
VALQDGDALPALLADSQYDVLQLDLRVPGGDGDEALRMQRSSGPGGETVLVFDGATGDQGSTLAAESEQAYGFLTRPMNAGELRRLVSEVEALPADRTASAGGRAGARQRSPHESSALAAILGSSPAILRVLETVGRIAAATASVLIHGETGTGKTLVARALHELSGRKDKPFVVVNCSAFQDQLLESELFGHEKGSFTGAVAAKPGLFEVADGGTLFLDEVAEMSTAMQAKVLQVLDTGELRRVGGTQQRRTDVRIVSASNKDLAEQVREDAFREDLLFRLNVIRLEVPALWHRKDDIPELIEHFLDRFRSPHGGVRKQVSPAALKLLQEYRWPGNVRELANTIEGLVLLAPGAVIEPPDLPLALRPAEDFELEDAEAPLPMTEIERLHIVRTLRYTEGNKAAAARLLGIDVKTLNNKIRGYEIELP